MDTPAAARSRLIRIPPARLLGASARAAYAYRGHWRAIVGLRASARRIARIEAEEWHHREQVGRAAARAGGWPARARELRAMVIGTDAAGALPT